MLTRQSESPLSTQSQCRTAKLSMALLTHTSPRSRPLREPSSRKRFWNLVWVRRIVYFATLGASFHLGEFWLFHDLKPEREFQSSVRLVSEFVRLVESFLPRQVVHWWTDYYAANPVSFAVGIIAVAGFIWLGSRLGVEITDSMRVIWNAHLKAATIWKSRVHRAIYALRTSTPYQLTLDTARRHMLPFSTRPLCFATGVELEPGERYSLTITMPSPWQDDANPVGYWTSQAPDWKRKVAGYATDPLRRIFFRPWFRLLARIGSKGVAEDFLDPVVIRGKPVNDLLGRNQENGSRRGAVSICQRARPAVSVDCGFLLPAAQR
jgi:hypothetical protein